MNKAISQLLFTAANLWAFSASAAHICPVLLVMDAPSLVSPTAEVSFEWRAPWSAIRPYIAPENGRVGGVLNEVRGVPEWLSNWWGSTEAAAIRARHRRIQSVRELPWRAFPQALQDQLLRYSTRTFMKGDLDESAPVPLIEAERYFAAERNAGIQSLKVTGKIPLAFPQGGDFFGTQVPPGTYDASLDLLAPRYWMETIGAFENVTLLEPMKTLTGEVIEAGTAQNLLVGREQLVGAVEYDSAHSLQHFLNGGELDTVQLHFRNRPGSMRAGSFFRGIRMLASAVGDAHPRLHAHLVDDLPMDLLHSDYLPLRMSTAISMVDFLIRANDLEEQRAIMEGYPLSYRRYHESHGSIWGTLEARHFSGLFDRIFLLMTEKEQLLELANFPFLGDFAKGGHVGVHWSARLPEKYDRAYAWGLHVRTLDDRTLEQTGISLLNTFQKQMFLRSYIQDPKRLTRWLDVDLEKTEVYGEEMQRLAEKIARSRWNKPWETLFQEAGATPEIKELLNERFKEWLIQATDFRASGVEEAALHLELKMLIHDPVYELQYFDNYPALRRIKEAQVSALKKIKALSRRKPPEISAEITHIMQTFLRESGRWQQSLVNFELREVTIYGQTSAQD